MVPKNVGSDSDESFEARYGRVVGRLLVPGRFVRLAARVRSGSLDKALIAGADPAASRQLAARAAELTSTRYRASIADGLEQFLRAAHGPPSRRRVLPRRAPALASAAELRELAALLRGTSPLYARGIAFLGQLLTDGTGPAYVGDRDTFARQLHAARAALRGRDTAARAQDACARRAPRRRESVRMNERQSAKGGTP